MSRHFTKTLIFLLKLWASHCKDRGNRHGSVLLLELSALLGTNCVRVSKCSNEMRGHEVFCPDGLVQVLRLEADSVWELIHWWRMWSVSALSYR